MKRIIESWSPIFAAPADRIRQHVGRLRQSLGHFQRQHLDRWLNPPTPKVILFASDDAWLLAVLLDVQPPRYAEVRPQPHAEEVDTPDFLSERINQAIRATLAEATSDLADAPVDAMLCLPASWCYSAQVSTEGLPRGNRHTQPLLYRLEEKLPLPAEDVTADFQIRGPVARGLAVATARLSPLLIALERHNVHVHTIAPTALLAVQGAIASRIHGAPSDTPRLVLLGNGDNVDLILLERSSSVNAHAGRPWIEAWHHLPCDVAMIEPWINLQCLRQPSKSLQIEAMGLPSALLTDLRQQLSDPLIVWKDTDTTTHKLASQAAAHILIDRDTPWFNLRQDALGAADRWRRVRPALHAAMLAAIFCLLILTLAATWRGANYRAAAAGDEQAQSQLFYDLYPGRPLPLSMRALLDSERRRLEGLAGQGDNVPRPDSALATLYETFRRLPTGLRFRLLELRFSPTTVALDGQVRSHADADVLAGALRAQNGLQVDPPRTERLRDQAIALTLHAKYTPTATSLPPMTPPLSAKASAPNPIKQEGR